MSRQIYNKTTKHIRIDAGVHKLVKIESAKQGKSIKELIEECLAEVLSDNFMKNSQ
jgi:predicted HicB family RNase H-like nuclease